MAHVQKFSKSAVAGLSSHIERKTLNHSNEDIDTDKSHLNYDLCEKEGNMNERLSDRLEDVHCLNRADVKVMADWVLTLPQNLKELPEESQKQFFEQSYEFLSDRYGKENVLSAMVHNDETTPHMHFSFVPVTFDEKKQHNKVSAKEVLTRQDLKTFHQDLDKHLKEKIPEIYQGGVLNDKTYPVKDVAELKRFSKELERDIDSAKAELAKKNAELNSKLKQVNALEGKVSNVFDTRNELDNLENQFKRTITGKVIISPDKLKDLKKFVVGVEKQGINDHRTLKTTQRKNETLTDKLNRTEANLKGVEHARSNLRLEVEELSKENKTLQDQSIVLESILEDKGATVADITDLEFDGRLILDKIERGIAPKTQQQGANWLDTLEENKKNKTIEPKRLENALERLKIMIDKLLTKLKSFSHER